MRTLIVKDDEEEMPHLQPGLSEIGNSCDCTENGKTGLTRLAADVKHSRPLPSRLRAISSGCQ